MLQWIQRVSTHNGEFMYESLRTDTQLVHLAQRIIANATDTTGREASLFSRTLSALVKEGWAYWSDHERDAYTVNSHLCGLGPTLLGVVRDMGKNGAPTTASSDNVKQSKWLTRQASQFRPSFAISGLLNTDAAKATETINVAIEVEGFHEDDVIAAVQRIPRYRQVPAWRIRQSLRQWVESSEIFVSGFKRYKAIC
jgi:hypothetical protein